MCEDVKLADTMFALWLYFRPNDTQKDFGERTPHIQECGTQKKK